MENAKEQTAQQEAERKPVTSAHAHGTTFGEEHILQFFANDHLPPHLRAVSEPFRVLAHDIVAGPTPNEPGLPRNPERTVALRKLLEAKDAAVRAFIAK